jgi:hypothetical protein
MHYHFCCFGPRIFFTFNMSQLSSLPDFSPCFAISATLSFIGSAHFAMVRYQEFKAKNEVGEDIVSSTGGEHPKVDNDNSDADEESEDKSTHAKTRRKHSSKSSSSLSIVKGFLFYLLLSFVFF